MALGPLWIVLMPLVNMVIFSVIFGALANLPSNGLPYPLFTYSGLVPWTYFAGSVGASVASLITNMNLISKVYFPRLIIPISSVISGLVDLAISFVVLLAMMVYYGYMPSITIITIPFYILLAAATALSVGLWSAALAVKYRDVQYMVTYGLQAWMYATPVAYSASLIPDRWQMLYMMNPMYWVVEGFRWSLLGSGEPPQLFMILPVLLVLLMLLSGAFVFRRAERNIVDLL
jgi:lipopolysaccharide transport system permease protein